MLYLRLVSLTLRAQLANRASFVFDIITTALVTGILYLFTGGLFLIGWFYDLWTLNRQIALVNAEHG